MTSALKFIANRDRPWRLLFFTRQRNGVRTADEVYEFNREALSFFSEVNLPELKRLDRFQRPCFHKLFLLYGGVPEDGDYSASGFQFRCYSNLFTYILVEHGKDVRMQ